MTVYSGHYVIRLADTDAAGVMFFSKIYNYAHDCYEDFMRQQGMPLNQIISHQEFGLPIINSYADHLQAIFLGQEIKVQLEIDQVSTSSFRLAYEFFDQNQQLLAKVKTVHVAVSVLTRQKIPLPEPILSILHSKKTLREQNPRQTR